MSETHVIISLASILPLFSQEPSPPPPSHGFNLTTQALPEVILLEESSERESCASFPGGVKKIYVHLSHFQSICNNSRLF